MPLIEGFRVRNFKVLKDITWGRLRSNTPGPLTPLVAVIGKNGAGKSSLFDAFGFLSDCLALGVEEACDAKQRGGFERLVSAGTAGPLEFEIYYRDSAEARPIKYELSIASDDSGRPLVARETLWQARRETRTAGRLFRFLDLTRGEGEAWAGEEALADVADTQRVPVRLTDPRRLGIATLGRLVDHPRIARFRSFLESWYLSYFAPDAARSLPMAGPQKHLSIHGDNLGNVVQYMEREHREAFASILSRIAERIPGIDRISTTRTQDGRLLLQFNDRGFEDPSYASQMSDGTLKLFSYMLLLQDPDPPACICIEEPENGLYHKLLGDLAGEFRAHATGRDNAPQVFVTTHQPYFVDALSPEETWIIEKGNDGFAHIRRASEDRTVKAMVDEGLPLGSLWYSDYLEPR